MSKVVDFAAYRTARRRQRNPLARLVAFARGLREHAAAPGDRLGLPLWGALRARLRARAERPASPARVVALRRPDR